MRSRFKKLYGTSGIFTVGVGIAFIVISIAGLAMSFSILNQPIKKTAEAGAPSTSSPPTPTTPSQPSQPTKIPTSWIFPTTPPANITPGQLQPAGNNNSPGNNNPPGQNNASPKNNSPVLCTPPEAPVLTAPLEDQVAEGATTITWNASTGATSYFLRINDAADPFEEPFPCPAAPKNPGDLCLDNLTTTSYTFTSIIGHRYDVWLHAVNNCGGHQAVSSVSFDVLPASQITPVPLGSCDSAPSPVQIIEPPESVSPGKHLVRWKNDTCPHTRYFVRIDDTSNPWNEPFPCAATPSNSGDICKDNIIAPVLGQVDFVAGHTYTLWIHAVNKNKGWNVMGSKTITVAGGTGPTGSITPSAAATATPSASLSPSPTPTMCLPLPIIGWKDEANKFTRTVITSDGTQTIEIIALHLKQITQSGVVVLVSLDNGTTWNRSDSSAQDDHFITVKNMQGKTVSIQIKLQDTCNVTGEILTVDVPPVPVASITSNIQLTKKPKQKKLPVTPIIITGAASIGVIAIAIFFIGL